MNIMQIGHDGFYHPGNEDQIRELILYAIEQGLKVRVRGSGHSVRDAIYTGNRLTHNGIDIMLDMMKTVSIDKVRKQVTVQAGCHLGKDPFHPTGDSDVKNSLFYQMDQAGLAIPDMGTIIHQTVGGFLSTGSAGGSVRHGFGDQLIALKFIDGNGKLHHVTRENNDDMFFAVGVSMGLLGIITEATFQCVDTFYITGEETTTTVDECSVDLFGDGKYGKSGIEDFLRNTEYSRFLWWPQKYVRRVVIWKARQMQVSDYSKGNGNGKNGQGRNSPDTFTPKPYLEFPHSPGNEHQAESASGLFYSVVGNWHQGLKKFNISFALKAVLSIMTWLYPSQILPTVIKKFVPLDNDKQPQGPQKFRDRWLYGLAMDNHVINKLSPTEFTEMWIPLSRAGYALAKLNQMYNSKGYEATGSYSCEVYAAKKSDFWLSPSYNEDTIRINISWFGYNSDSPANNYFPQFWNLLMNDPSISCRFHWGKHIPVAPDYVKKQYPRWEDFLSMRNTLDPNKVFLTRYWERHLGIKSKG